MTMLVMQMKQEIKDLIHQFHIISNKRWIKSVSKSIGSIGLTSYWEACASCYNYMGLVRRPYIIEMEYYDIHKNKHIETFEGFSSTVISHEYDHLNGILHMDIADKILELPAEERKKNQTKRRI